MRRIFGLLFLIHLWVGSPVHAEDKVLRLGILGSLTGFQSVLGRDLRDGAVLAIDEVNQKWREEDARIEPFIEDDRALPERAEEAAQQLIANGIEFLFGVADSDCALAVRPLVEQARIPMWTVATHEGLTAPPNEWIFRGNISDRDQATILTDYLWDSLQNKKIALLYEDTAYGRSGAAAQLKRIQRYGSDPAAQVMYRRSQGNLSAQLEEIKSAGAKGILTYGIASDAPAVLRAIQELGMDVRIMASSGWDTRQILRLPSELTEGVLVGGYLAFAEEDREELFGPSWESFARSFRGRFNREPDVMAAHSYSGMMCVAEAFERVDFDDQKLVQSLEETKAFETLLESVLTFDDENRDGVEFIHFAQIQNGQAAVWKRNKMVREQRFQTRGIPVEIAGYRGKVYKTPVRTTMWMVVHFAFGRPPFIKDFPMVDEYGLKSTFVGALFKNGTRIPLCKLIFVSEEEAIESLNLSPSDSAEAPADSLRPIERTSYRDRQSGMYTDGQYWAGYKRVGDEVALASGDIPREAVLRILDAVLDETFPSSEPVRLD